MRRRGPLLAACLLASGCSEARQDFAEVVLEVDTDVPVPRLASRLRVDTYLEDGTWFSSRDLFLNEPEDWPASFSLVSPQARRLLVRLRAFPDGKTRDFRGERFPSQLPWAPPAVAYGWDDLCDTAPTMALGESATVRVARQPFGQLACDDETVTSGIAAVAIDIPPAADGQLVRFEVLGTDPDIPVRLQLQSACVEEDQPIACVEGGTETPTAFIEQSVSSGRYYLLVAAARVISQRNDAGGIYGITVPAPADISVAGYLVGTTPPAPTPTLVTPDDTVRDIELNGAATPVLEPQPSLAIDRLVRVELTAGRSETRRVTLHGECMGTQALLGGSDPTQWDAEGSRSCIDEEGQLADVQAATSSTAGTPSRQGQFGESTPCSAADLHPRVACVPAGVFVLGTPQGAGASPATVPERVARLQKFWIDRNEVTVGDVRREFRVELGELPLWDQPTLNPFPLSLPEQGVVEGCTFSNDPAGRENHPINCVDWTFARAFCRHRGGDLPTAAQWEYVATAAWRSRETTFPWGDDVPSCERSVHGRLGTCGDRAPTVQSVSANAMDATPGMPAVLGLGGNLAEWVLDAMHDYDHPCWRQSTIDERLCWAPDAPYRTLRGGFWAAEVSSLPAARHFGKLALAPSSDVGFRCVYAERPR